MHKRIGLVFALFLTCWHPAAAPLLRAQGQGLFEELFAGLPGILLGDLTNAPVFPHYPTSSNILSGFFELPGGLGGDFGIRLRGQLVAPATGSYTFWIASDDESALYLSTDDQPANKRLIGSVAQWTATRSWEEQPSQKSSPIYLVSGRRYYLETLMKQNGGGYNLAVRWQLPNGTLEEPIPTSRFIPYRSDVIKPPQILRQPADKTVLEDHEAVFDLEVADENQLAYQWQLNRVNIPGANRSFYGRTVTRANNDVRFRCVISNPLGTNFSAEAILTVSTDSPPPIPGVFQEIYASIGSGTDMASLTNAANYPYKPSVTAILTEGFETPYFNGDYYGQRLRAWVIPPVTGNYRFWLASDDNGLLYLSTDEHPAKKKLIAKVLTYSWPRCWFMEPGQQSAIIPLVAGHAYYIEALQQESDGLDGLAVAWQIPGDSPPENGSAPIPGAYCRAFENVLNKPPVILASPTGQSVVEGEPLFLKVSVTGTFPMSFQWRRNGADIAEQTNAALFLPACALGDSGDFSVCMSNALGTATSTVAHVTIFPRSSTPAFEWLRWVAGTNYTDAHAVGLDDSGNCYLLGSFTERADFGATNLVIGSGQQAIFLAKFTPNGQSEWIRLIATNTYTRHLAVSPSGSCFLAGYFDGSTSFGATRLTSLGGSDSFVAKYNSAGLLEWVRRIGGPSWQTAASIAVDHAENVCFGGTSYGFTDFGTLTFNNNDSALILAKYDTLGQLLWARHARTDSAQLSSLAMDEDGNCYLTGGCSSWLSFDSNQITADSGGIFLTKYSASGECLWVRQAGAPSDWAYTLTCDRQGNPIMASSLAISTNRDIEFGNVRIPRAASGSFVAKYTPGGDCLWARAITHAGLLDIGTDYNNNCYVCGFFSQTAKVDNVSISAGINGACVVKFDATGALRWMQRTGGEYGTDYLNGVAIDHSGNVWLSGYTHLAFLQDIGHFGSLRITNRNFNGQGFLAKMAQPAPISATWFLNGQALLETVVTNFGFPLIRLQCENPNALVFYTVDGSNPSRQSRQLRQPLLLYRSATIRALACLPDSDAAWEMTPLRVEVVPAYALAANSDGGGEIACSPAPRPLPEQHHCTPQRHPRARMEVPELAGGRIRH